MIYEESFVMSKPLIMCAAISIWLSTAALDRAYAIGTFRLEGPWPSSNAQGKANGVGDFDGCNHEPSRHVPLPRHPHQSCFGGPDRL